MFIVHSHLVKRNRVEWETMFILDIVIPDVSPHPQNKILKILHFHLWQMKAPEQNKKHTSF